MCPCSHAPSPCHVASVIPQCPPATQDCLMAPYPELLPSLWDRGPSEGHTFLLGYQSVRVQAGDWARGTGGQGPRTSKAKQIFLWLLLSRWVGRQIAYNVASPCPLLCPVAFHRAASTRLTFRRKRFPWGLELKTQAPPQTSWELDIHVTIRWYSSLGSPKRRRRAWQGQNCAFLDP